MEEEFNKLLEMFSKTTEGGEVVPIEKILGESLAFFDKLKDILTTATPEEREELVRAMQGMYAKLAVEGKKLAEKSGVSEEKLMNAADNPANFSPEQWELIRGAKEQLFNATRQITRVIQGKAAEEGGGKEGGKMPPPPPPKPPKLTRRDEWLKP